MDKSSINTIFNSLFGRVEGSERGYRWKKHRNMCVFWRLWKIKVPKMLCI